MKARPCSCSCTAYQGAATASKMAQPTGSNTVRSQSRQRRVLAQYNRLTAAGMRMAIGPLASRPRPIQR